MVTAFFSFKGRVGRQAFLIGQSVAWAAILGVAMYALLLDRTTGPQVMTPGTIVWLLIDCLLALVLVIAAIWTIIALTAKRLHDCNYTGLAVLLHLVEPIGILVTLVLFLLPGTRGANRFGEPPDKQTLWLGQVLSDLPAL